MSRETLTEAADPRRPPIASRRRRVALFGVALPLLLVVAGAWAVGEVRPIETQSLDANDGRFAALVVRHGRVAGLYVRLADSTLDPTVRMTRDAFRGGYWADVPLSWTLRDDPVGRRRSEEFSLVYEQAGVAYPELGHPLPPGWQAGPHFSLPLGFAAIDFARGVGHLDRQSLAAAPERVTYLRFALPLWPIAAIVAAVVLLLARPYFARLLTRREPGRCVRCGYDLRATPGRCSECGTVADAPRDEVRSRTKP